jgi:hypothetical protein
MHEDVFAILAAEKSITLSVVEPLHCSLFHVEKLPSTRLAQEFEAAGRDCAGTPNRAADIMPEQVSFWQVPSAFMAGKLKQ